MFGSTEKTDQILSDSDWARIAEGFGCFGKRWKIQPKSNRTL